MDLIGSKYFAQSLTQMIVILSLSGESPGDPDRTEAAHHQWQDSPSPSPSHSGHQAVPGVTPGHQVIRVVTDTREQETGAQPQRKEKLVNRDLVEMVSN